MDLVLQLETRVRLKGIAELFAQTQNQKCKKTCQKMNDCSVSSVEQRRKQVFTVLNGECCGVSVSFAAFLAWINGKPSHSELLQADFLAMAESSIMSL